MTKEDRNRADARFNKAARAANDAHSVRIDRDAALKAVTDNMAKLKALRLAREAAAPAPSRRSQAKRPRRSGIGSQASKAVGGGLKPACARIKRGAGFRALNHVRVFRRRMVRDARRRRAPHHEGFRTSSS
jgi:hypothetical protein